jgi:hypothetical protein
MSTDALAFNGIDGATGAYLYEDIALDDLERRLGPPDDDVHAKELKYAHDAGQPHFGVVHGVEPESLAEAGWGVVVPDGTPREVLQALEPLLALRRDEAGGLFYELPLTPGTSKQAFLAARSMGPGRANPAKVPYYLLLVGGPDAIPYRFQYELDGQFAVGRVAFETPQEYRAYADGVVAAEGAKAPPDPELRLFGSARPGDRASVLSATQLVRPLARELTARAPAWDVRAHVGETATKDVLGELLWGTDAPELVFTAGHGIGYGPADGRRRECQGALVTHDWPGPGHPVAGDHCVAAVDVPADRPVRARIVFAFACFGAGTPEGDGAPPFISRLPQRLLGNPAGGALAFVGHVDRALGFSFAWPDAGAQREHFWSTLLALCDGWRVGHAKEYFDDRYMDVNVQLNDCLDRIHRAREVVDPVKLAELWTACHDARNYLVLGDPAVRLPGRPADRRDT